MIRRPWRLCLSLGCCLSLFACGGAAGGNSTSDLHHGSVASAVAPADLGPTQGSDLLRAAHMLAPYLVVRADQTIAIQAPSTVRKTVPAHDWAILASGVEVLNAKIRAGELATTAAGQVYRPSAEPVLATQDGATGQFTNWWGQSWCISDSDLSAWQAGYYVAAVAAILAVFDPVLGAVAAAVAATFVAFDNGNGSCFNQAWSGAPSWWSSQ